MLLHESSRPQRPASQSSRVPRLQALRVVALCLIFVGFTTPGLAQDSNLVAIQTLIRQSKLDDADKQLQAILQKQPTNAKALTLLGVVRRRQGNWPDAETMFRRAIAASPQSLDACENLANLLRDETRWPEAVAQYEKCHKLAPRNFNVAADLAIAYQKNSDYSKSLAIVKTIPQANRPVRLLPAFAADYVALKDSQNADAAIADVVRHASSDPELVPALANSFLDHGMTKDAAELLQLVRDHQKITPSFLSAKARAQAALDNSSKRAKASIRLSASTPSPRTPWLPPPRWPSYGASGTRPSSFWMLR